MSIRQAAPRPPTVFVSLWLPVGRRRLYWYAYRCGRCGAHQFGRAPRLDAVTGERTAGCGHRVRIVVARVYGEAA